jgi:hypothetical protein
MSWGTTTSPPHSQQWITAPTWSGVARSARPQGHWAWINVGMASVQFRRADVRPPRPPDRVGRVAWRRPGLRLPHRPHLPRKRRVPSSPPGRNPEDPEVVMDACLALYGRTGDRPSKKSESGSAGSRAPAGRG